MSPSFDIVSRTNRLPGRPGRRPSPARGTEARRRAPLARASAVLLLALAWGAPPRAAEQAKPAPDNPHGSFVEECNLCHRPDGWIPVRISERFDHARFGFALEGAHAQTTCMGCHRSLDFTKENLKTACVTCHQDVHKGELGADCSRCHSPRSFVDHRQMLRTHQSSRFPLTGAHLSAECEGCHKIAALGHMSFIGLRTDCEACHLDAYMTTTNPNHQASSIPRDCERCHNSLAWTGARFTDHDGSFFPIFSGKHLGKWVACSDCHIDQRNFATFSCTLGCHVHADEAKLTAQHAAACTAGNALACGFAFDSLACYGCHPQGRKP